MTIARASAGSLTSSRTVIVTSTSEARGLIESMVPTGTPTTLTLSPGYRPTADGKYAITCLPPRDGHTV